MYECPGCGAGLRFDPASQMMVCSYCQTNVNPETALNSHGAREQLNDVEIQNEITGETYPVYYYTCPQCGGVMITEDNTGATFCSYCGSSNALEVKMGRERKPTYIIPFKKTKAECEEAYKKALSKAIFAPSRMKKDAVVERFRGIYMPYWIYHVKADGNIPVDGSKSHRAGDYIITERFRIDAQVNAGYSGITHDASSSFEDRFSTAIAPYDMRESKIFTSAYLSGFYADTADVDNAVYDSDVKSIATTDIAMKMGQSFSYSSYGVNNEKLSTAIMPYAHFESVDYGMFPVWFLSNKTGDRVSYAVVNGQTGKVAMDIPIDPKKYLLGSLILAAAIFGLLALFGTYINTTFLLFFVALADCIMLIVAGKQVDALFTRESMLSDKGYNSKKTPAQLQADAAKLNGRIKIKKAQTQNISGKIGGQICLWTTVFLFGSGMIGAKITSILPVGYIIAAVIIVISNITKNKRKASGDKIVVKAPGSMKAPVIIKPIIGMILCVLPILFRPANDLWYYGVAIASAVLTVLTVIDLIRHHNMLTSRKLPQFNKRGGEQYE